VLGWPEEPAVEVARTSWPAALRAAITGDELRCFFQPIVDVRRGTVVGYEALARIAHPAGPMGPSAWFAAARAHGVTAELEAACLAAALSHRSSLPPNCFLSVNVGPDVLGHPLLRAVLEGEDDLTGVVLELTEHAPIPSYAELDGLLRRYRGAGALVAVDDAGAGYAGLQHLLNLRPSIIKLDRSLVAEVDRDEAKRSLVQMLGAFADRLDAWLLAEGVERPEELDVLADLRVALAQGYVLARPAPPWEDVGADAAERLRARGAHETTRTLRDLVRPQASVTDVEGARRAFAARPDLDWVVVLDGHERPVELADRQSSGLGLTSNALRVNVDTPLAEAGRRAVVRPPYSRFQPIVCTDNAGRYVGVVPIERLVEELAAG